MNEIGWGRGEGAAREGRDEWKGEDEWKEV